MGVIIDIQRGISGSISVLPSKGRGGQDVGREGREFGERGHAASCMDG